MKKLILKKSMFKSLLSLVVLGVFLLLAAGSIDAILTDFLGFSYHHDRDVEAGKSTHNYWIGADDFGKAPIRISGPSDEYGRWNGLFFIQLRDQNGELIFTIATKFDHGYMTGKYSVIKPDGSTKIQQYYYMDNRIEDEAPDQKGGLAEESGFDQLNTHYTWLLHYLEAFGYAEDYVEHFMDTLEVLLSDYSFEAEEFDKYYEEAIDVLKETPYDSIIELNSALSGIRGLELIKRIEFRLAVIDHYRSSGTSTYNIVSGNYPGILDMLDEEGVSHADFEVFCNDLDDSLAVFGPLDTEDFFFIDSVDARLYRAIITIYNSGEESAMKASEITFPHRAEAYRDLWLKKQHSIATTSPELAEMVLYTILMEFFEGDMIIRSVREAYLKRSGFVSDPIVATQFLKGLNGTSVRIEGYVIEDGGAEVINRGITWAAFFNPTLEDNVVSSGNGTGRYSVDLDGLTEGMTYYARAFASNSTDTTVYGNCISFAPKSTSSVREAKSAENGLSIYPNPASFYASCHFQLTNYANVEISVFDLAGRTVYRNDQGFLPSGDHKIMLDVTGFPEGVFHCELISNGNKKAVQKLVVIH